MRRLLIIIIIFFCKISENFGVSDFFKELSPYWCKKGHFNLDQAFFIHKLSSWLNPKNCLEIGFCTGRSAASLLISCIPNKFVSIDISLDYTKPEGRQFASFFQNKFKCFKIIEADSNLILKSNFIEENFCSKLDWILIDGGHSFGCCTNDLNNVINFLADEGVIVIDDYKSGPPNGCKLESVTNAVDEFFLKNFYLNKLEWNCKGKGFAILTKSKIIASKISKLLYV